MLLSIVAPCFDEEEGLEEFYLRMRVCLQEAGITDYEMILIDDGSADRTWDIIKLIHRKNSKVRGLKLSRNFGHQAALTAGLHEAAGEFIFIIDSDLQDPPELLIPMLSKIQDGYDVVYGKRKKREGETWFKLASARAFYRVLQSLADIDIPADTGDFRLMRRKVLLAYKSITETKRFTRGLISWLGFRQTALLYDRHSRFAGTTKYPLRKMINFSLDAITGFSLKPLRLIILTGGIASVFSLAGFIYSLYGWYYSQTVPGWASLMAMICLISCVQLVCIGVVGEYVGRTFLESKRRPLYLLEERLHNGGARPAKEVDGLSELSRQFF